jgi:predicted MFS family arabinose efflux permease
MIKRKRPSTKNRLRSHSARSLSLKCSGSYAQKKPVTQVYVEQTVEVYEHEPDGETIPKPTVISKRLVWTMAIASGFSAANLIYAQPLLATISHSFAVSINQGGLITTLGLLGYAIGLVLLVPLGEKYNQRNLIVLLSCAVALALVFMATAPTIALLIIASCIVGLTSVIPELIIPFAANLSPVNERGKVVGAILAGFLVGTPLASILSGIIGAYLSWRAMYWIAAATMAILALVLRFLLPDDDAPKQKIGYPQLIASLWKLLLREPVLQEVSVFGILVYGAFNVFWVSISFILKAAPYHYGSEVVGLFGLVGFAGALAAVFVGKSSDHNDPRRANGSSLVVVLLSFMLMWVTGQWLIGLIIGTILLDLGAQSSQVTNETRLYSLDQSVWNRLNTVYILMFCIGGSLGSLLGSLSWSVAQENGVYATACLMLFMALGFYALHGKRIRRWKVQQQLLSTAA